MRVVFWDTRVSFCSPVYGSIACLDTVWLCLKLVPFLRYSAVHVSEVTNGEDIRLTSLLGHWSGIRQRFFSPPCCLGLTITKKVFH